MLRNLGFGKQETMMSCDRFNHSFLRNVYIVIIFKYSMLEKIGEQNENTRYA